MDLHYKIIPPTAGVLFVLMGCVSTSSLIHACEQVSEKNVNSEYYSKLINELKNAEKSTDKETLEKWKLAHPFRNTPANPVKVINISASNTANSVELGYLNLGIPEKWKTKAIDNKINEASNKYYKINISISGVNSAVDLELGVQLIHMPYWKHNRFAETAKQRYGIHNPENFLNNFNNDYALCQKVYRTLPYEMEKKSGEELAWVKLFLDYKSVAGQSVIWEVHRSNCKGFILSEKKGVSPII